MSATTAASAGKQEQEEKVIFSLDSLTQQQIQDEKWEPVLLLLVDDELRKTVEFVFTAQEPPFHRSSLEPHQLEALKSVLSRDTILGGGGGLLVRLVKVRPRTRETAILLFRLIRFVGLYESETELEDRFDFSKFTTVLISTFKLYENNNNNNNHNNNSFLEWWAGALVACAYNVSEKPLDEMSDPNLVCGEELFQIWIQLARRMTNNNNCSNKSEEKVEESVLLLSQTECIMLHKVLRNTLSSDEEAVLKLWCCSEVAELCIAHFCSTSRWLQPDTKALVVRMYLNVLSDLVGHCITLEVLSLRKHEIVETFDYIKKNFIDVKSSSSSSSTSASGGGGGGGGGSEDDEDDNQIILASIDEIQNSLDAVDFLLETVLTSSSSSSKRRHIACLLTQDKPTNEEEDEEILDFLDKPLVHRICNQRPTSPESCIALLDCATRFGFVDQAAEYDWTLLTPCLVHCADVFLNCSATSQQQLQDGLYSWANGVQRAAYCFSSDAQSGSLSFAERREHDERQKALSKAFSSLCLAACSRCKDRLPWTTLCLLQTAFNFIIQPVYRESWCDEQMVLAFVQLAKNSNAIEKDGALSWLQCIQVLCSKDSSSVIALDPSFCCQKLASNLELVLWRLPKMKIRALEEDLGDSEDNEQLDLSNAAVIAIDDSDLGKLSRQHALLTVFRIAEKSSKSSSIGNVFDSIWAIKICTLRFLLAERKK